MILLTNEPIRRETLHRALLAEGFVRTSDVPATKFVRTSSWDRSGHQLLFASDVFSGSGLFLLSGPEAEQLVALCQKLVPCTPAAAFVEAAAREERPGAQALATLKLYFLNSFLLLDPANEISSLRPKMTETISRFLLSEHRPVRMAALEIVFALDWKEFEPAVMKLAEQHADLASVKDHWLAENDEKQQQERERARPRWLE
jgi:hypothetical protein